MGLAQDGLGVGEAIGGADSGLAGVVVEINIVGPKAKHEAGASGFGEAAVDFSLPALVDELASVAPDAEVVAGDGGALGKSCCTNATDPAKAGGVAGAVGEGVADEEDAGAHEETSIACGVWCLRFLPMNHMRSLFVIIM